MTSEITEIKSWLEPILKSENVSDFSVEIQGNSGKGDGYLGDIVFIKVDGISGNELKKYNLVLKCSKRNESLRKTTPMKDAFVNEIYIYETVLPLFTQFQIERGIAQPFNSFPKYYGSVANEQMEVIVLENLKAIGYSLCDKSRPLTCKQISMTVQEYGKFHAISAAMQVQNHEIFEKLTTNLVDCFGKFVQSANSIAIIENVIDEIVELLQNELEPKLLEIFKNFKKQVAFILVDLLQNFPGFKVIRHGDCWSNNFLFNNCDQMAILDWQISDYSSPIFDLSYFLFSCISEIDLPHLGHFLEEYYNSFSLYLKKFGINSEDIYSFEIFLNDWEKNAKFGFLLSTYLMKICTSDTADTPDIAKTVEDGGSLNQALSFELKDKEKFKGRIRPLVEFATKNNLLL